jgi:hypothetical protein
MNITDQIKGTKQYKELSSMQKILIIKKTNITDIKLGVAMSRLTSLGNWKLKNSPRLVIENIVKQIIA